MSAFASRGLCADLFELILLEHELVIGAQVLMELRRSLRQKIKLPAARCDEIIEFLREDASTCVASAKPVTAAVDDNAVIQRLTEISQMKIFSPRGFWDYLHSQP